MRHDKLFSLSDEIKTQKMNTQESKKKQNLKKEKKGE